MQRTLASDIAQLRHRIHTSRRARRATNALAAFLFIAATVAAMLLPSGVNL